MTPDELAKRLDPIAWRIAVDMEIHAAISTTTKSKANDIVSALVSSTELQDIILAAEARGMERQQLTPDELSDDAIDALRLLAFKTNSAEDKAAYLNATSKWFQYRQDRAIARDEALQSLIRAAEARGMERAAEMTSFFETACVDENTKIWAKQFADAIRAAAEEIKP